MFNVTMANAQSLLKAYRAEVENQRKNLDALNFIISLVEKAIDKESDKFLDYEAAVE